MPLPYACSRSVFASLCSAPPRGPTIWPASAPHSALSVPTTRFASASSTTRRCRASPVTSARPAPAASKAGWAWRKTRRASRSPAARSARSRPISANCPRRNSLVRQDLDLLQAHPRLPGGRQKAQHADLHRDQRQDRRRLAAKLDLHRADHAVEGVRCRSPRRTRLEIASSPRVKPAGSRNDDQGAVIASEAKQFPPDEPWCQVRPIALGLPTSLKLKAASQTAIWPPRMIQTSTPRPAIWRPVAWSSHSPSQ